MAASEPKFHISNTNPDKNKKQPLYFSIMSMQTKQIIYIYIYIYIITYIVKINKNLKMTDEKKYCFKCV